MKSRNVKNLILATALVPALSGMTLIGCDDEDTENKPDTGVDAAVIPDGLPSEAGTGDGSVSETGGPTCTTTNTPINANITANTTWDCPSYLLKRIVYVTNNAVLTIKPGVVIYSDTDVPTPRPGLLVTRGAKLIANGTPTQPIVFTSGNLPGARKPGDLAGVALMGSARLNSGDTCVGGTGACAAPAFFQRNIEGLAADPLHVYGGNDDLNSCGELSYVRIEFAGTLLSTGNELNGLTLAGCGSGTKVSHVQIHRGQDDGVEIFGGTVNLDHILVTADEDDALDWDFGYRGRVQFLIVHKWMDAAKSGNPNAFEGDSATAGKGGTEIATPRSAPQIYNATLIGNTGYWGMTLRSGTRATIRNVIQQGFSGLTLNVGWTNSDIMPAAEWPAQLSIENSFFWMNGPYTDAPVVMGATTEDLGFDESASLQDPARKNQFAVNPMIKSVAEMAPDYTPTNAALAGQAVPPAGFDATATYAGAVAPNMPSWTAGWTAYPKN